MSTREPSHTFLHTAPIMMISSWDVSHLIYKGARNCWKILAFIKANNQSISKHIFHTLSVNWKAYTAPKDVR